MDNHSPNPASNPSSGDAQHPKLIDRLGQFGCGCFLWLPVILLFFVTPLTASLFESIWGLGVICGTPLVGLFIAVPLIATSQRRWGGIGLLAGLLLYCLILGILLWTAFTEL